MIFYNVIYTMPNPWIEHVKRVAKEMNVPYGCAISYAKKSYKSRQVSNLMPGKPDARVSDFSDIRGIKSGDYSLTSSASSRDSKRKYNLMPGIRGIARRRRRK